MEPVDIRPNWAKRLRQAGMYGIAAGGIGGLFLDFVAWIAFREGSPGRVILGLGLLISSFVLWVLGSISDPYRRRRK